LATKWISIKGRLFWPMVYEPDEAFGDTRWKVNFEPFDEYEWTKFRNSGMQQEPKENNEGTKTITLRRQTRKVFPKDDEATYFTPPEITGAVSVSYVDAATGEKIKSYKKSEKKTINTVGEQVEIGNGSVGIVNVAVFDAQKGKGHRLESIQVLDLVHFERRTEATTTTVVDNPSNAGVTEIAKDMNDSLPW